MKRFTIIAFALFAAGCFTAWGQSDEENGELWLCSGQSNMELPIRRCLDVVAEDVKDYRNPSISYLKVPIAYDFNWPLKELPGCGWEVLDSPEKALDWGAVCYYVAKGLTEADGRKVRMLNSSVGGSPIEAWMRAEDLPDYAKKELLECRDPQWIEKTLWHNAHLYSNWQAEHDGLPANDTAKWEDVDVFSDWGYVNGHEIFGSHYLRNTFKIKASQRKGKAVLHLGAMRDADSTFVNGHYVGNTTYMYPPRNYEVPAEYLKTGKNTVEIHLYAADNGAGFIPDKEYSLETVRGKVSLLKGWQHKAGRRMHRRPGQIFLQYKPSGLYNAMIAPITECPKGVIWYQGESNAGRADNYGELLKAMILSWREHFHNDSLPFYIIELAAYEHSELQTAETSGWVRIQDIQRQVAEEMDNVYVVHNRDLGEWNDIHPQDKKTLGERVVKLILENESKQK